MAPKFLHGLLILSGVGLVLFLIGRLTSGSKAGRVANVPDPIQKAFNKIFDQSDYKSAKDNWLAVSKMETGGWKSKLFINLLNLWGMKKPKVRPTTADGAGFGVAGRSSTWFQKLFPNIDQLNKEGVSSFLSNPLPPSGNVDMGLSEEWARYATLDDAVKDILLWMDYTKFPKETLSLRSHIDEMKKRKYFAEDLDYYLKAVIAWEAR